MSPKFDSATLIRFPVRPRATSDIRYCAGSRSPWILRIDASVLTGSPQNSIQNCFDGLRRVSLQAIVDEDVGRLGTIACARNQTFQRLADLVIGLQHLPVRRKLRYSFLIWTTLAQERARHREIGGKHLPELHLPGPVRQPGPCDEHA